MKEFLLKLKKAFIRCETLYLLIAAAFIYGGISYIPKVHDHPVQLWNVLWNSSFGFLFLAYFIVGKNRIIYQLTRFCFYVYFAVMMIIYVIVFNLTASTVAERISYIVVFGLCQLIIIAGIYFSWSDYKKEKFLATKCQGKGSKECDLGIPCVSCEEYREYRTPEEVAEFVMRVRLRNAKRKKRDEFFNNLKIKLRLKKE